MAEDKNRQESAFDRYVKEQAFESLWHTVMSTPAAAQQDYATVANLFVPGDDGKRFYQNSKKLHNIDDGEMKHELAKIIIDTTATLPISAAIAGGVNLMNLGSPSAARFLKFGGNSALSVGAGAAKANTAGNEYTAQDCVKDAFLGLAPDIASSVRHMPKVGEYMVAGTLPKIWAVAKKTTADELLDKEEPTENYDSLYAYKGVRE